MKTFGHTATRRTQPDGYLLNGIVYMSGSLFYVYDSKHVTKSLLTCKADVDRVTSKLSNMLTTILK